jgi:6-pyruvoyltetrahydropterin/6-carboxytetrahydropterin synthase
MSGRLEIVKAFTFEAAHHFRHMPVGHGYQRMHGHSYHVEVAIAGAPDPASGWIADLGEVARALDEVKAELDHNTLNDVAGLETPSLETISRWIAGRLAARFPGLSWVKVARPSCQEYCVYRV